MTAGGTIHSTKADGDQGTSAATGGGEARDTRPAAGHTDIDTRLIMDIASAAAAEAKRSMVLKIELLEPHLRTATLVLALTYLSSKASAFHQQPDFAWLKPIGDAIAAKEAESLTKVFAARNAARATMGGL